MNMKIQSELFFTPFSGERGRSLNYFFSLGKNHPFGWHDSDTGSPHNCSKGCCKLERFLYGKQESIPLHYEELCG